MDKDTVLSEDDTTNIVNLGFLLGDTMYDLDHRIETIDTNLDLLDYRIKDLEEAIKKLKKLQSNARRMSMGLEQERKLLTTITKAYRKESDNESSDE